MHNQKEINILTHQNPRHNAFSHIKPIENKHFNTPESITENIFPQMTIENQHFNTTESTTERFSLLNPMENQKFNTPEPIAENISFYKTNRKSTV